MYRAAMPKVAIHEDGKAAPREYQIGRATSSNTGMQTESGAETMQGTAKEDLRLRVRLTTSLKMLALGSGLPGWLIQRRGHSPYSFQTRLYASLASSFVLSSISVLVHCLGRVILESTPTWPLKSLTF